MLIQEGTVNTGQTALRGARPSLARPSIPEHAGVPIESDRILLDEVVSDLVFLSA